MERIGIEGIYYNLDHCGQKANVTYSSVEHYTGDPSRGLASWMIYNKDREVITTVHIPDTINFFETSCNVTNIGEYAFYGCSGIISVSIPKSVTNMEGGAFALCSGIKSVTCYAETPPAMGAVIYKHYYYTGGHDYSWTKNYEVFDEVNYSNAILYVPRESVMAYREADQWKKFNIKSIEGNYSVSFQNWDGTELLALVVKEDSIPVYTGATPTRPEDDEFIYTFSGWTPEISAATHNTIYTATYTTTRKTYTITWQNEDGSLIDHTTVEYGVIPTHADPVKDNTAEYTYTFTGWSPDVVAVIGDATYRATFDSIINKYEVLVTAENGVVKGDGVYDYGTSVTLTPTPNYGYHFVKWNDGNTDNPRTIVLIQDTVFAAVFAKNTYQVAVTTNENEGTVNYPTQAEYLDEITMMVSPNYGYHFVQWNDGNTDNPRTFILTQDTTFTAEFGKNTYHIVVATNEGGDVNYPVQAEYLDEVTLTTTAEHAYHFAKWNDGNTDNPRTIVLTQDTTFEAFFEKDTSGQCGENLYWQYSDGTLTFTGSNDMYDYESADLIPWIYYTGEIQNVTFVAQMTSVGDYAFSGLNNRKFNEIILPQGLLHIGKYAFDGDAYIETIDFGANLESIGEKAFNGCTRVVTMTCLALSTPDVDLDGLTSISSYAELYVMPEALRKYEVDPNWSRFLLKEYGSHEGIDNIFESSSKPRKVMIDNVIYILRGDKVYTVTGQLVK